MKLQNASAKAFRLLHSRGEKVSFAESLTGGMIAAAFVENPGASSALDESYVTYAAASKVRILGVRQETMDNDGVVSAACAREMAAGVRRISSADWGVSATGLAGPDGGTDDTPVGTVFIGVAGPDGTQVNEFHFRGNRDWVRTLACSNGLNLLRLRMIR